MFNLKSCQNQLEISPWELCYPHTLTRIKFVDWDSWLGENCALHGSDWEGQSGEPGMLFSQIQVQESGLEYSMKEFG